MAASSIATSFRNAALHYVDAYAPAAPKHGLNLRGYRYNIRGFARDVFGIDPWRKQREILESVQNYFRTAATSGHKIGKSTTDAIVAWWFYCTFPESRVVLTATTDNQVNGILWREIRRLWMRAKRKGIELPGGEPHEIARSGIVNPTDLSEIKGYTAKEAEAIAGVSGPAILYIVDEASGVKAQIFQAIQGNRAGGNAWVLLTSNPTRADGENYDAHHSKRAEVLGAAAGYHCFQIDSRDSPNVTGEWRELEEWDFDAGCWRPRTGPIPGLAQPEWVDEMVREHGEDSPIFAVRVKGSFVVAEQAKIFPIALLTEAGERWADPATPQKGRLILGVDPAGDGEGGDETKIAPRRAQKIFPLRGRAGLPPAGVLAEVLDTIAQYYEPGDGLPVVNIESEGEAGWRAYCALRDYLETPAGRDAYELRRVRTSDAAVRQPHIYDRVRDELAANLREWLRGGGALPPDVRLEKELHAYEFIQQSGRDARLKVTHKKDLRKLLGHSPDSADAVMLAAWEPLATQRHAPPPAQPETIHGAMLDAPAFNPYSGLDPWRSPSE
jgi:phage terminase large subunit